MREFVYATIMDDVEGKEVSCLCVRQVHLKRTDHLGGWIRYICPLFVGMRQVVIVYTMKEVRTKSLVH